MKDKDWLLLAGLSATALIGGAVIMYYSKPHLDQFVANLANPKQRENPNPEEVSVPKDNPGHRPERRDSSFQSLVQAGQNPYFTKVELLKAKFSYDKGMVQTEPIKGKLKGKYQQ